MRATNTKAKIEMPLTFQGNVGETQIKLKGGKTMTGKKQICGKATHKMLATQLIAVVFAAAILSGAPLTWWRILAAAIFWLIVAAAECQQE